MFVEVVDTFIIGQVQVRFLWHPEIDDVKLMECDDCHLVRYCGDECQRENWPQHEDDCKQRAAELRDEILFKQPEESHLGDCPICMTPLPLDQEKFAKMECCSKFICFACGYASGAREVKMRLEPSCPFCREPFLDGDDIEEKNKRSMKRIEANDPVAMCEEGIQQHKKGHNRKAFDYYTKASELGNSEAHYHLAWLYQNGEGIEKDMGKAIHHYEEAAIGGNPYARYSLGVYEWNNNRNAERAVKHHIIAANLGLDESIKVLMKAYKDGLLEKEDLDSALRSHKAAVDATKSPERDLAEEFHRSQYNGRRVL